MKVKKLKIYLETSVWNFLFASDAPDKQKVTEEFFAWVEMGECKIYISDRVLAEIEDAPEGKRGKLIDTISRYKPESVAVTDEAIFLSERYVQADVLPRKAIADALHVAIATVSELDILVSWNLRHLVRYKTRRGVNAINLLLGYKAIDICTPEEVFGHAGQ